MGGITTIFTRLFGFAKPNPVNNNGVKQPQEAPVESNCPVIKAGSFSCGIVAGFFNGFKSMLMFLFHAVTSPVETVKNLIQGGITLAKLLASPSKLCKVLGNAWDSFKNASSYEKGKVLGEILFNVSPFGSLQNMRLLSSLRRIPISITAISNNWKLLQRYHRMTGGNWFNTILAGKRIAAKANLKIDFQRILKAEGIPTELAPKLRFVNKAYRPGVNAWYSSTKHEICITRSSLNRFLISDFIPGFSIGGLLKHEVKHASQHLLMARAGIERFLPPDIAKKAYELMPIKPGSKLYDKAQQMFKSALNYPNYFSIVTSNNFFMRKLQIAKYKLRYFSSLMERQAWYQQFIYQGLMPRIHTPSIHLLEYLTPQNEGRENDQQANYRISRNISYVA